jgi:hypothetical protein
VRFGREWGSDGCTHPFVGIFRRLEHLVAQSAVHLATDTMARILPLSWPASKSRETNLRIWEPTMTELSLSVPKSGREEAASGKQRGED